MEKPVEVKAIEPQIHCSTCPVMAMAHEQIRRAAAIGMSRGSGGGDLLLVCALSGLLLYWLFGRDSGAENVE